MIQFLKRQWQPKTSKVLLPLEADVLNNELRLYFVKQGKYSPSLANIAGHFISDNVFEVQMLYSSWFNGPTTGQMQAGWSVAIIQCTINTNGDGSIIEITTTPQKFILYGLFGLIGVFILSAVLIGIAQGIDIGNTITTLLFGLLLFYGIVLVQIKTIIYFSVEGLYKVLRTIAGKQQITIYPHPR